MKSIWHWLILGTLLVSWVLAEEDVAIEAFRSPTPAVPAVLTRTPQSEIPKESVGYFKYGLGIGATADAGLLTVKTLALGYQSSLLRNIIQQWEAGLWADGSNLPGRSSSAYGGWSVGVNVEAGYLNLQSLWGAVLMTTPDSMLGGVFQFHQDLLIGVKDEYGCVWGVNYAHFSSAGLEQPNNGRDLLTLRVGIPF